MDLQLVGGKSYYIKTGYEGMFSFIGAKLMKDEDAVKEIVSYRLGSGSAK